MPADPLHQQLTSPAQPIPPDDLGEGPEDGVALCLSGGGYRAMVFHIGVLWRLNEAKLLERLQRISSVSGGSITAGVLGTRWTKLGFQNGVGQNFVREVVEPLRQFASRTIDAGAIVGGIFLPGTIADRVASAYRKFLFGTASLQSLPDAPRFVFNATSVQSGVLWRFSKPYMADYRVGRVLSPDVEIAVAVGASSAFPPVLSPVEMHLDPAKFEAGSGTDLASSEYRSQIVLTDGGVYDNLGLETAWKRYRTILVSDAGGRMAPDADPEHDWARHALRILDVIDNQVRSLRKRQVIEAFKRGDRTGAYWGIRTNIADYQLADALTCPVDRTMELANIATRLQKMDDSLQERLINWGYAVCDAALRKHVDSKVPKGQFPYPRGV